MVKTTHLFKLIFIASLAFNLNALTLDEAIKTTLNNSTDLKKISMNVDAAKSDVKEKKSANFGRVDLLASYTHYNLARTLGPLTPQAITPTTITPTTQDMMVAGIAYNVELFSGMATMRSIEIASLQKEMTRNLQKLTKEQLIYNVKTLYVNILSLKAQKKAQALYVEALQSLHKDIVLRVQLGSAARLDELKSSADLNRALSKEQEIKSNIEILKATLASVMMVQSISDLEPIDIKISSINMNKQNYIATLEQTTKLKNAQLEIDKKQKLKEKALAMYYPKISFNAYYGQNAGVNDDTNANSGDFNNQEIWQAGVDLKWNIFDFGKTSSLNQKSKIALMQSRLDKMKTKRDLEKSLTEALSKIELAIKNYQSAQSELSLMDETQKIEQLRYDNGAADINDLLYAKARYQLAKSSLINATYSYQNSKNYLQYLLEKGQK
ncbi:TolC family protein [Sulfurimonas sp.]